MASRAPAHRLLWEQAPNPEFSVQAASLSAPCKTDTEGAGEIFIDSQTLCISSEQKGCTNLTEDLKCETFYKDPQN